MATSRDPTDTFIRSTTVERAPTQADRWTHARRPHAGRTVTLRSSARPDICSPCTALPARTPLPRSADHHAPQPPSERFAAPADPIRAGRTRLRVYRSGAGTSSR